MLLQRFKESFGRARQKQQEEEERRREEAERREDERPAKRKGILQERLENSYWKARRNWDARLQGENAAAAANPQAPDQERPRMRGSSHHSHHSHHSRHSDRNSERYRAARRERDRRRRREGKKPMRGSKSNPGKPWPYKKPRLDCPKSPVPAPPRRPQEKWGRRRDSSDSDVSNPISVVTNVNNIGSNNVRFNVIIGPHSDPKANKEVPKVINYADAHFHLDRTALFNQMVHFPDLQDLLDKLQEVTLAASDGFRLELAVANFCDPHNHGLVAQVLERLVLDERLVVTIGAHPNRAGEILVDGRLDPRKVQNIRAILTFPKVRGFGEIGLDGTRPNVDEQRSLLRQLLTTFALDIKNKRLPLVLHIRGGAHGSREELTREIQQLLFDMVGPDHPMQLHCFRGDVTAWGSFSKVYFSIVAADYRRTPLDSPEARLLAAVPEDRILLETDAPYFGCLPGQSSSPEGIPRYVAMAARIRAVGVSELLTQALQNTKRLFLSDH